MGMNVEKLRITHIDASGTAGTTGSFTQTTGLPRAICVEILVRDRKGQATIALSSGVYLPGSGL
jgi:hypothetical protein